LQAFFVALQQIFLFLQFGVAGGLRHAPLLSLRQGSDITGKISEKEEQK
jgi:hypothetical protein